MRWGITLLAVFVLLVVISGTTTWVRDVLQRPLVESDALRAADVVIVLGSGTTKTGDHVPAQAKQRVMEGMKLVNEGLAPRIIVSGGRDTGTKLVEASTMSAFAVAQGFMHDIIEEGQSRDTFENAKGSLAIMEEQGWTTAIVVTSPYHTWRACKIFRAQKADVRCIPAPYSLWPANGFMDRLKDTKSVVREYGAIVYNWLKGEL